MRKLVFLIAAIILGFVIAETWADEYYPEADQTPAQSYITASAEDASVVYLPNEEDRCSGRFYYGGIDLTLLQPHVSSPWVITDYESKAAPRIYLGMENCCGLGVRASYWNFDQDFQTKALAGFNIGFANDIVNGGFPRARSGLHAQSFDLEVTQSFYWCQWKGTVGAGLRYARVESAIEIDRFYFPIINNEAVGPTFSADFSRPLGNSNFAIAGQGRIALLYGNTELLDGLLCNDNGTFNTYDIRMGLTWSKQMRRAQFTTGIFYEAQIWTNSAYNLAAGGMTDLGFVGPTIRFEIGI